MPKLDRGRAVDLQSMQSLTANELEERAAKLEAQALSPHNTDDPAWLQRWADRLRALAAKKQKGLARRNRARD